MKKLILKTTAITLASALGLLALLYGIFALFIPRPLANLYDKMGMYSTSIRYYEKAYSKSQSLEDLYTLCLKIDGVKDSQKTQQWTKSLVFDAGFSAFSKTKDVDANGITTEEYMEGKYVRSVYKNQGLDNAIVAVGQCIENASLRYPEYNPVYMLLTDASINWNSKKAELVIIREYLLDLINDLDAPFLSDAEKTVANNDLAIIQSLLG